MKQKWLGNELKCVKLLLPEKRPHFDKNTINHTNNENFTALQLACMRGHYDGALLLLKSKADPTIVKGYLLRVFFFDTILFLSTLLKPKFKR